MFTKKMKLISKLSEIAGNKSIIVTIGNFDGVHLGHRRLLEEALKTAKGMAGDLVVISFVPHPQEFFSKLNDFYLNSFEERRELLKDFGVKYFLEINFDEQFSNLSPEAFLREYILSDKRVKKLYLGHDFSFGKSKTGNLEFVEKFLSNSEVQLEVFPEFKTSMDKVSSSLIRDLIRHGKIEKTNELLGRKFFIKGKVVKGKGRGATIGVPTVNLEISPNRIVPAKGVYFTKTYFQGKYFDSITNIGVNPTFRDDNQIKIETHILDFSQEIYGEDIVISFLKKLREEKKFNDFNELKLQINADIKERINFQ
jgi:riboflavin kinase / FMN adenylyltransferase